VTLTAATGAGAIVRSNVWLTPSLVAVIVALPMPTAATSPLLDTVAIAGAEVLHVIVRPVSTLFAASRSTAVTCTVSN
jgi:hypothetical protein